MFTKPRGLSRAAQRKHAGELMARLRDRVELPPFAFCRKCQSVKPLDAFAADARQPDGLATNCKTCRSASRKR